MAGSGSDRYTLSFEKFDGTLSAPVVREIVDRGHAVAVLPFDPATGKVLLIRQFLAGAYAAGVDPWPLQTIAGMIDTSESAADTALREAEEETGLKIPAGSLRPSPVYLVSPGAFTEIVHVFHVEIDLSDAGGVHGLASESEDIRSEIRNSNQRLDTLESTLSQRLGSVESTLNQRLGSVESTLNQRLGSVESALLDLAEQQRFVVRYTKAISERDARLEPRVIALEARVEKLESK